MLTLAYIRGVEIRCSVPVLLLVPAAAVFGTLGTVAAILFSLTLHEFAHAIMAERLGCRICSMDMQPFGFVARLQYPPATSGDAAAIALAGPMVSLLMAVSAAGILYVTDDTRPLLAEFAAFNLALGLMNLLPVLPLDGGRLLSAAMERRIGRVKAVRILSGLGAAFGAACTIFGIFLLIIKIFNPSPLITGVFIMLAALAESRTAASAGVKSKLVQNTALRHGRALTVHTTAMSAETTVRDALRSVNGGGYNLIILLDPSCRSIGVVDEGTLLAAAFEGRSDCAIRELLPAHDPMRRVSMIDYGRGAND